MADPIFVGREREIAFLQTHLARSLNGQGQVVLVQGEAGLGKTALLQEFARRAQAQHRGLLVAVGDCSAQTGAGEPYLPFREAIGLLTGDFEAKLAQGRITVENVSRLKKLIAYAGLVLLEVAPDLIDVLVPGGKIISKAGLKVGGKVGKAVVGQTTAQSRLKEITTSKIALLEAGKAPLEQEHIFEQCASFLVKLAAKQPLLITLDDMQWADASSLSLLYHLARRIDASPILIVGAYRPEEVSAGRAGDRHPLEKVEAELVRLLGGVAVALDRTDPAQSRWFVDAYVDSEPNHLGEAFRAALARHTDGHPLFVVELLRDLQARGALTKDAEGYWVDRAAIDWSVLPARVEGVVRDRIGRLDKEQRAALTVASVAGQRFIAELVAELCRTDARAMVHLLSEDLGRRQRLVETEGIERIDSRRLSFYRFRHHLYQSYVYDQLDEVERSYLHEDMATAMEALYAGRLDEIAVQLGWHFDQAGRNDRAVHYLRQAGALAAASYAHAEALQHFSRALELTPAGDLPARAALLLDREAILNWMGDRTRQAQDLQALADLVQRLHNQPVAAEVSLRRANYYRATGDLPAALEAVQAAIATAGASGASAIETRAYGLWGRILLHQGNYAEAREWLEIAMDLAQKAGDIHTWAQSTYDMGVTHYYQDDFSLAERYLASARDLYTQVSDLKGEVSAGYMAATIHKQLGHYQAALDQFEQSLAAARRGGWRQGEMQVLATLGNTYLGLGNYIEARRCHEQALASCRAMNDREGEAASLDVLGLVAADLGDLDAALQHYEQALAIQRAIGYRRGQGYTLTHLGYALTRRGQHAQAAQVFQEALTIRRELSPGSGAWIDDLAGLALAALAQGEPAEARRLAGECLAWIEAHGLGGMELPAQVYLACFQALQDSDPPRAARALDEGHRHLMQLAGAMDDPQLSRAVLEDVPIHRELIAAWQRVAGR